MDERIFDREGNILSSTRLLDGAEVWWVDDRGVVIESYGSDPRQRGARRTWIRPRDGEVVSVNLREGLAERSSWRRWEEERLRAQRGAMVEALRRRDRTPEAPSEGFFGGYAQARNRDESGRRWTSVSALPGRIWRCYGRSPHPSVWRSRWLPLAFEGVTRGQVGPLRDALAELEPRHIEDVVLPRPGRMLVLRRHLQRVRRAEGADAVPELDDERLPPARTKPSREELWAALWSEESRPVGWEMRDVRLELEEGPLDTEQLEKVRGGFRAAPGLLEREEFGHLYHRFAPDEFLAEFDLALDSGDIGGIVAWVSVASLREPGAVSAAVARALPRQELWREVAEEERAELRSWLEGVAAWVVLLGGGGAPESAE